ncbi:MAG: hypothetical protein C4316_11830, partial [Chloroflexota bacterium]
MRIAALVLGIIGGLAGLAGAVFALFVGSLGSAFGAQGAETVIGLGFAAIPLAVLGLAGAGLVLSKPKTAAWCMGISAVGGLIAIFEGYMVATLCLGAATVMAIAGRKEQRE